MEQEAQAIGDGAAQARAATGLAQSQDGQGDHRAALESATRAEAVARQAGAQVELAMALFTRGWELYRLGDAEAALALGEQALALSKLLSTPVELSFSLSLLGAAHNTLGHADQAIQYMEQALELDRSRGALHDVASSLNNLGSAALARGDYATAAARYEAALNTARKIGFRWGEMSYRSALSGAWVGLEEYAAAEAAQRQVIDLPQAARWVGLSSAYRYLAEACLGQGKLAAALDAALQALERSRDTARPEPAGQAWRVLGLVAAHLAQPVVFDGHTYPAAACFAESERIFTGMGAEGERARTLRAWAWYERTQGDPARGERLRHQAAAAFAALGMAAEVARMQTAAPSAVPLAG